MKQTILGADMCYPGKNLLAKIAENIKEQSSSKGYGRAYKSN